MKLSMVGFETVSAEPARYRMFPDENRAIKSNGTPEYVAHQGKVFGTTVPMRCTSEAKKPLRRRGNTPPNAMHNIANPSA